MKTYHNLSVQKIIHRKNTKNTTSNGRNMNVAVASKDFIDVFFVFEPIKCLSVMFYTSMCMPRIQS